METAIYELRAYIGASRLFYTQIFATLEAATQRAIALRANYSDETPVNGTINRLDLNGDTYEFTQRVCYL